MSELSQTLWRSWSSGRGLSVPSGMRTVHRCGSGVEGVEAPSLPVRWGRSTLGDVDGLGLLRAAETDLNVARSDPGVVLTSRVAAGVDGDDIIGCGG